MEFTYNWFNNEDVVLNLIEKYKPHNILEIGAFEGLSTSKMLVKAAQFRPISFYAVDSWEGGLEHNTFLNLNYQEIERRFESNLKEVLDRKHNNPISMYKCKGYSHSVLSNLICKNISFDFIYIDGSHKAADVLTDATLAFKLLRKNGIMIFDDYEWDHPYEENNKYYTPKIAVDSFVECFGDKLVDLYPTDHTYQKYYQKKAE